MSLEEEKFVLINGLGSLGQMLALQLAIVYVLSVTVDAQINPLTFLGGLVLNPGGVQAPLPNDFLLTKELIERVGFKYERHEVITEDGYILQLHRIVNPNRTKRSSMIPVLMMHGFVSASDIFLFSERKNALPFVLTDEGYDVWLGDFRGNFYSRAHVLLSPEDPLFWNFTFHEHGVHDLPTFVDRILEVSGQPKLFLIGYSLSCCAILIMNSLRPEYNDKIYLNVHLGPGPLKTPAGKMRNPYVQFLMKNPTLMKINQETMNDLKIYEFLPRTAKTIEAVEQVCGQNGTSPKLCVTVIRDFYGNNLKNLDRNVLVEVVKRVPAGSSILMYNHIYQVLTMGWRQFDWDEPGNLVMYNSTHPPNYPLERITSQNLIVYGANDYYATKEGTSHLASLLQPNVARIIKVPDPRFSHFDYVFGKNAKEQVFETVIDELSRYSNKLH